jgi:hypothetical protein
MNMGSTGRFAARITLALFVPWVGTEAVAMESLTPNTLAVLHSARNPSVRFIFLSRIAKQTGLTPEDL